MERHGRRSIPRRPGPGTGQVARGMDGAPGIKARLGLAAALGWHARHDRDASVAQGWYQTPFLDRRAHVYMWRHGFWWVEPPHRDAPDDHGAGVREPLRPVPTSSEGA